VQDVTIVKIAQCPLCKGMGTVNRSMICPRCDGGGILDEKVLAAEHRGRLQEQSDSSSASNGLSGEDDTLPST
jgi:DnaJ-class molecular chaperone